MSDGANGAFFDSVVVRDRTPKSTAVREMRLDYSESGGFINSRHLNIETYVTGKELKFLCKLLMGRKE